MPADTSLLMGVYESSHPRHNWVLLLAIGKITYAFGLPGGNGDSWRSNWDAFIGSGKTALFSTWDTDLDDPSPSVGRLAEVPARQVLAGKMFEFPWLDVPPLWFGLSVSLTDTDIVEQFDRIRSHPGQEHSESTRSYRVAPIPEIEEYPKFDRSVLRTHGTSDIWNL